MGKLFSFLATGFGSGYSPVAPGTAGALVGCVMLWGLHAYAPAHFPGSYTHIWPYFIFILITTLIGVISANHVIDRLGKNDPSEVVIDEMVGMWIAMFLIPFSWDYLLAAFILFRFFDIVKPLYIRKLEAIPKGWGVMLDDVLAGIYANLLLHAWLYFGLTKA